MRKILSLWAVLVLLLYAERSMAQTIVATPKTQTVSCTGTATINVAAGGQSYFVTVNGGLIIVDNGQEKSLLVTSQPTITVRAASGPGKVYVSLASDPDVIDSVSVDVTPITLGAISGSTCIASNGTAVYSVPAVAGVSYLWRVGEGGAYTTILSGGNTNSVTVQSVGTGNTSLRVYAYNDCTGELCAAPTKAVWIRKTFSVTAADFSGVECLDQSVLGNDSVIVFLIKPYLGLHSLNDYEWTYSAGLQRRQPSSDGSAISFKVIDATVDQTVSVTVGKTCNPGNILTKVLKAAPAVPVLTQSDYCFPTNQTTATFTIDPSYHKSGYVYTWNVPVNWAITATTATSITVNMDANAGNITVTAKNGLCGNTPKTFTVNRSINGATVTGSTCVAFGAIQAVNYTISPLNNNSYTWTLPDGWTFQDPLNKNGSSVWVIPDGIHGGNVTAVTQGCGGTNTIPPLTVAIGPAQPLAITGSACVADNSTVTYSIAQVTNATSYEWVVPSGWGAPTVSNGGLTITVNAGVTLGGIVKVRALGCGSTASAYRELPVEVGPPQPATLTGPTCVARDASSSVYTVSATPNATGYEWQVPAGWVYTLSDGDKTLTVTGGITVDATLSVRAKGCGTQVSAFRSLNVKVGPAQPAAVTGPACVVPGAVNTVYSTTAVTGATSYDWSVPSGWVYTPSNGGLTITVTSAITTGGTVGVRGIGCESTTGPYRNLLVSVAPAQPGTITYYVDGTPGVLCIGKGGAHSVTLNVPAVSGATSYTWTIPAGWTGLTSTSNPTNTIVSDASTGGVVTVAASASGCTGATQSITLQRSGLTFCVTETDHGDSFYQYIVTGLPGAAADYIYKWYLDDGTVLFGPPTTYRQIFLDASPGITTFLVDIAPKSNSSCFTTLRLTVGGGGNCTPAATQARTATQSTSRATSETGKSGNLELSLYPNPASQEIQIKVPGDVDGIVGYVYFENGTLVKTLKVTSELTVDVSSFTNGAYFVQFKSAKGVTWKKFIVQH